MPSSSTRPKFGAAARVAGAAHAPVPETGSSELDTALDATALARLRELDPSGRLGVLPRVLKAYEGALHKAILQLQSLRASALRAGGPAEALHPPLSQPAPGAVPHQSALRAQSAAVQLARLAHTLKSSSASVGALNLARACEACEKKLNLQPETDVGPETEQLLTPAEAALRAVQAMLAR